MKIREKGGVGGVAYTVLLIAIVVMLVSGGMLYFDYGATESQSPVMLSSEEIQSPTGFSFVSMDDAVTIKVNIKEGVVELPVLAANPYFTGFNHVGEDDDFRLVTNSTTNPTFHLDEVYDNYFVISWVSGDKIESYAYEIQGITSNGGINTTTLNNLVSAGSDVSFNRVGDVKESGPSVGGGTERNLILVAANDASGMADVRAVANAGAVYGNRIYDTNGNYVILPSESDMPKTEYILDVYNKSGKVIEKYFVNVSSVESDVVISRICADYDGRNYNVAVPGDRCMDSQIVTDLECNPSPHGSKVSGDVSSSTYNCSIDGKICSNGACIPAGECVSNFVAHNSTCHSGDKFETYYTDSSSCPGASIPTNVAHFCDYNHNGVMGDAADVSVDEVSLGIKIDGSQMNSSVNYSGGIKKVVFNDSSKSLIEFNWDFSNPLNLGMLIIEKEDDSSSFGYIIISGLNVNKTVYVSRIAGSDSVCIKDEEVDSINEVSAACDDSDEVKVDCPGHDGGYSCKIVKDKFRVSGLMHSAVREYVPPVVNCVPGWNCTSFSSCSGGLQTRTCIDSNSCGTTAGKPSESQNCTIPQAPCTPNWKCSNWKTCIDGNQGRVCSDFNSCGTTAGKPSESQACEEKSNTRYILIIIFVVAFLIILAVIVYILSNKNP